MRLDVLAATCLISHFFRTCSADALASQVSDAVSGLKARVRADPCLFCRKPCSAGKVSWLNAQVRTGPRRFAEEIVVRARFLG